MASIYVYDSSGNKKAWAGTPEAAAAKGLTTAPPGSTSTPSSGDLGKVAGVIGVVGGALGGISPYAGGQVQKVADTINNATQSSGGNVSQGGTVAATTQDPYAGWMAQQQAYQQQLANAQRQSRVSALSSARDSALSGLDAESATIDPYYYDKRNQAAAASDVGAMNFANYMASRGIKGSAGAMPEIYRNAGLQNRIGALDTQQAGEVADIARRRSDIGTAYESDVASANADIDAQTMQAYIDSMNTAAEVYRNDQAAKGYTSTGELTLQGKAAQNSEVEQQAALQAQAHYNDIQAYINTLDPNDPMIPYLQAARQSKTTDQADQAAAAAAAAGTAQQQQWTNQFNLFKTTGQITTQEQSTILGLPVGTTVADVDIARMNALTSRMNANTAATNATSYDYKTDPTFQQSISNINASPQGAVEWVTTNAQQLISDYTYDGYLELLQQAQAAAGR